MIDPNMRVDRRYKGMVRSLNQLIETTGVEKNPVSMLRESLTSQASRVIELFERWDRRRATGDEHGGDGILEGAAQVEDVARHAARWRARQLDGRRRRRADR